jgi:hypothetical protein
VVTKRPPTPAARTRGLADSGTADSGPTDGGPDQVPAQYEFNSRFGAGSSVSYTGQTFRHVLVAELKGRIGGLTARIDQGTLTPTTGSVLAELNFYLDFDPNTGADVDSAVAATFTSPPATQTTFGDFGSTAKLRDKIAGNDRDRPTPGVEHHRHPGLERGRARDPDGFVDSPLRADRGAGDRPGQWHHPQ